MPHNFENLADDFIREHGREAIGLAFHLAAECLEDHDGDGYERYFQIYVRLARRSGKAGALSAWHEQASRQESDSSRRLASVDVERH